MTPDDDRVGGILALLAQRLVETTEQQTAPAQPKARASQATPKAARAAGGEQVPPALRNRRHWVVVSYDIPNDRRRTRVMKTLEGFGHRVQYSVFECELRPADLDKLKARLKSLIQKEEDDIRFYDLCENCQGKVTMLGRAEMYRQAGSVMV